MSRQTVWRRDEEVQGDIDWTVPAGREKPWISRALKSLKAPFGIVAVAAVAPIALTSAIEYSAGERARMSEDGFVQQLDSNGTRYLEQANIISGDQSSSVIVYRDPEIAAPHLLDFGIRILPTFDRVELSDSFICGITANHELAQIREVETGDLVQNVGWSAVTYQDMPNNLDGATGTCFADVTDEVTGKTTTWQMPAVKQTELRDYTL